MMIGTVRSFLFSFTYLIEFARDYERKIAAAAVDYLSHFSFVSTTVKRGVLRLQTMMQDLEVKDKKFIRKMRREESQAESLCQEFKTGLGT